MSTQLLSRGTLAAATIRALPLVIGKRYLLMLGFEGDNFNSETVTPKLSDGANSGAKAAGTLTIAAQPTAGDTMTIGSRVYTFVAAGETIVRAGASYAEIEIGAALAATQANTVAAINGTAANQEADPSVTAAAFATNDSVITARAPGTAGNTIATTETFTSGSNIFDAAVLGTTTAGTDTYGRVSALPTVGSSDSDGSPLAFAAPGQIEFAAAENVLLLVPSGAVTSVRYTLAMVDSLGQIGHMGR